MDWTKLNEEEDIFYTFTEYLLDKKIIEYHFKDHYSKSKLLHYFYTTMFYKQYEDYCKDNGFDYEKIEKIRGEE